MSGFLCPNCGSVLSDNGRSYVCINGHCYDKSASGYVNLMQGGTHGDDAAMVRARRRFLSAGHYNPLCEALCTALLSMSSESLLDAGCGEGYYTSNFARILPDCEIYGIDISKNAADKAAKLCKNVKICVGSVYRLPFADDSFDCIVNVFSPLAAEEYLRVCRGGGYFIYAVSMPDHLIELKRVVYDDVFVKEMKSDELPGFRLVRKNPLSFKMDLSNEELSDLFEMTPYSKKTNQDDIKKLECIKQLNVTASFCIFSYVKE